MGVVGAALRGFGKALKRKGKVYKTIKSVKPLSGKTPWYVGASPNTAASRSRIVKTAESLKRSGAIDDAVKDIKKAKEKLKHMEATGRATSVKDYKGKPMEKINIFFEHFSNLPKWFTNLWILVVASVFGIKGTQIFRNGGKKK